MPVLPVPTALEPEPVVMAVMAVVMLMMVVAFSCKRKMLYRPVGLPPTRIQPLQPVRQWRPPTATGELACSVVLIDGRRAGLGRKHATP